LENLINNVKNYSVNLSYIQYKKIALSFISLGLTYILDPTTSLLKSLAFEILQSSQNVKLIVFNKIANLLLSCLSFTFNLGFIDFENEWELKETFTLNVCIKIKILFLRMVLKKFPESWSNFMEDSVFHQALFQVFTFLYTLHHNDSLIVNFLFVLIYFFYKRF